MAQPANAEVFCDASAAPLPKEPASSPQKRDEEDALISLLSKIPISSFEDDFCAGHGVLEIRSDLTVQEALHLLVQEKAMCAAVLDKDACHAIGPDALNPKCWGDRYLGLLELASLLLWCLMEDEEKLKRQKEDAAKLAPRVSEGGQTEVLASAAAVLDSEDSKGADTATRTKPESFFDMVAKLEGVAEAQVGCLSCQAHWVPFMPLETSSSLLDAISLISCHGIKSIPVLPSSSPPPSNTASHLQGFITQISVLKALLRCKDMGWFERLIGSRSLLELGFPGGSGEAIGGDDLLMDGMKKLAESREQCLAVVEGEGVGEGQLLGALQVEDLVKLLEDEELFARRRDLRVREFLEEGKRGSGGIKEKSTQTHLHLNSAWMSGSQHDGSKGCKGTGRGDLRPLRPPVICHLSDSISALLETMVQGETVRALVVEDKVSGGQDVTSGSSQPVPSTSQNGSLEFSTRQTMHTSEVVEGVEATSPGEFTEGKEPRLQGGGTSVLVGVLAAKELIGKFCPPVTEPLDKWGGFFGRLVDQVAEDQVNMLVPELAGL